MSNTLKIAIDSIKYKPAFDNIEYSTGVFTGEEIAKFEKYGKICLSISFNKISNTITVDTIHKCENGITGTVSLSFIKRIAKQLGKNVAIELLDASKLEFGKCNIPLTPYHTILNGKGWYNKHGFVPQSKTNVPHINSYKNEQIRDIYYMRNVIPDNPFIDGQITDNKNDLQTKSYDKYKIQSLNNVARELSKDITNSNCTDDIKWFGNFIGNLPYERQLVYDGLQDEYAKGGSKLKTKVSRRRRTQKKTFRRRSIRAK
jgi:hypothetical protein